MIELKDFKKVLVLVPHPDDELLGCGGLLLKFKSLGTKVHLVLFTKGESLKSTYDKKSLMEIRVKEFRKSISKLGISSYEIFDFPDGQLEKYEKDIKRIITKLIDSYNPDTVILPFIFDPHKDHSVIGKVGFEIYKSNPHINFLMYLVHTFFRANFLVDISDVVEDLKEIFEIYKISLSNETLVYKNVFVEGFRRLYALPNKGYMESYILLNEFNSKNDLIRYILSGNTCTDVKFEALEKIDQYHKFIEYVSLVKNENKNLSIKVKELMLELEIKEHHIKKLYSELEDVRGELDFIKRSIFYRLMVKYRNFIDKYFPENSYRRKFYSRMVNFIKSWIL